MASAEGGDSSRKRTPEAWKAAAWLRRSITRTAWASRTGYDVLAGEDRDRDPGAGMTFRLIGLVLIPAILAGLVLVYPHAVFRLQVSSWTF